jgi:hypothetical protein
VVIAVEQPHASSPCVGCCCDSLLPLSEGLSIIFFAANLFRKR